jgi:hypothetical protein
VRSHVKNVLLVTCALRVRCAWMRVLSAQVGLGAAVVCTAAQA